MATTTTLSSSSLAGGGGPRQSQRSSLSSRRQHPRARPPFPHSSSLLSSSRSRGRDGVVVIVVWGGRGGNPAPSPDAPASALADLAFLDFAGVQADLRLRVVAAIFVTVSLEFKTSEMIEHAALQVSLARVLLVAVRGQNFHYCQKKVPLEQKAVPAKNGIHVFPMIFTSEAGFLLASCDKKVTYVTQRFFWR